MLSGSLDTGRQSRQQSGEPRPPRPRREDSPHLCLPLCSFPNPALRTPASLPYQLSRAGVRSAGGGPPRLCSWTSPCPSPLGAGQRADCGACDSRRKPRTAAPAQPSPRCPGPTLTENSIGARRGPLIGGGLGGLGHLPAQAEGSSLCKRKEQEGGLGGRPRAPSASVLKHKWQGGPNDGHSGTPASLAGYSPPPAAPFILPFLGVEIETQG